MFKLLKIENASMNVPEPEIHDATVGESISIGEALVLASGKVTKCGPTTTPQFVAMGQVNESGKVAVCRVSSNQVYEVPVTAAPTTLKAGDKVTIHGDGLQVTATTTSGVATVDSLNGATAVGDTLIVRFI